MTGISEVVLDYNFFECPVCLELFDDTCKMLPCQHTFHKRCLQKIYSTEARLECPQCRKLVSEDIEVLPRNFWLLSVLEKAKPKSSEFDEENLQLQFVIEKSKSEAEVKAREEYLLSQKEKLEYELMLLKSEKKSSVSDTESQSQSCLSSSTCEYSSEGRIKENDCLALSESAPYDGAASASSLVEKVDSLSICDKSVVSSKKSEAQTDDCCSARSLEQQVTDAFNQLNMFENHASLAAKLLEIVRAVDHEKNFQGIELMHLIDYDDLIESYLNILTDQMKENFSAATSYLTSEERTRGDIAGLSCAAASCGETSVSTPASDKNTDPFENSDSSYSILPLVSIAELDNDTSNCGAAACERSSLAVCSVPAEISLGNDYQSYSFDDDDENMKIAMELSRRGSVANEPDYMIEEVLFKSKITCIIDQQKYLFLNIREKVEFQIALLMSKI